MGPLGDWVTDHNFKGLWVMSELKKGVLRTLHSIPSNMGVPPPPAYMIMN